jgi:putative sterol carrier protein
MVEKIFASLSGLFVPGAVEEPISYYFSLGEIKKTVLLSPDSCLVEDGRTVESADCVCKTSGDFFEKIWNEGYRPGMADFLSGKIKSNDPGGLQIFLKTFGKTV